MKITRSNEIESQVATINKSKAELLGLIQKRLEVAQDQGEATEVWQDLLGEVGAISEAFSVSKEIVPYDEVDRRGSFFSGPFFVSKEFPVPLGKSGQMRPLVQFDMDTLSKAVGSNLGSGLLQLWYDLKTHNDLIRIIPADAVETQDLVDFQVDPLDDQSAFPLPIWMELDPVENGVEVINGLVSIGFEATSWLSVPDSQPSSDLDGQLCISMSEFERMSHGLGYDDFLVGGTLFVIQYTYSDVKMRQLLRFSEWGSSGSAEIFFQSNPDGSTDFSFWACFR